MRGVRLGIDWELVAKVVGAGYGLTFLALIILALCTWLLGIVIQRNTDTNEGKDS